MLLFDPGYDGMDFPDSEISQSIRGGTNQHVEKLIMYKLGDTVKDLRTIDGEIVRGRLSLINNCGRGVEIEVGGKKYTSDQFECRMEVAGLFCDPVLAIL